MFKKVLSILLAVVMVTAIIPAFEITSSAASWTIRQSLPTSSDAAWKYYSSPLNTYPISSSGGNCTWYAYGRAYEVFGSTCGLPAAADASGWYGCGLSVGDTPKAGSIICWANHVGFVESVSGSTVTWTESNWDAASYGAFNLHTRSDPWNYASGFRGYIYLDGTPSGGGGGGSSGGLAIPKGLPTGCLDSVTCVGNNEIHLRGWAFDGDSVGSALEIHVYVGGAWNSGAPGYKIYANAYRPDVNDVFPGAGNNHGFDATIKVDRTGSQPIYVYAINIGGSDNKLLGSPTVNIVTDNTPPVISNYQVTDVDATGCTVSCTVTDNSGIDRVQFPTWTAYNDQDDLIAEWTTNPKCSGSRNGNTFTYRINISDHNYEYGDYCVHIYAWDTCGNVSCLGTSAFVPEPQLQQGELTITGKIVEGDVTGYYFDLEKYFPEVKNADSWKAGVEVDFSYEFNCIPYTDEYGQGCGCNGALFIKYSEDYKWKDKNIWAYDVTWSDYKEIPFNTVKLQFDTAGEPVKEAGFRLFNFQQAYDGDIDKYIIDNDITVKIFDVRIGGVSIFNSSEWDTDVVIDTETDDPFVSMEDACIIADVNENDNTVTLWIGNFSEKIVAFQLDVKYNGTPTVEDLNTSNFYGTYSTFLTNEFSAIYDCYLSNPISYLEFAVLHFPDNTDIDFSGISAKAVSWYNSYDIPIIVDVIDRESATDTETEMVIDKDLNDATNITNSNCYYEVKNQTVHCKMGSYYTGEFKYLTNNTSPEDGNPFADPYMAEEANGKYLTVEVTLEDIIPVTDTCPKARDITLCVVAQSDTTEWGDSCNGYPNFYGIGDTIKISTMRLPDDFSITPDEYWQFTVQLGLTDDSLAKINGVKGQSSFDMVISVKSYITDEPCFEGVHFGDYIPVFYTVNAMSNDLNGKVYGSGQVMEGESITLYAESKEGYKFTGWKVGGILISTDEVLDFVPESDITLIAEFDKVDVIEKGNGDINNDGNSDILDVVIARAYIIGTKKLTDAQIAFGDMNGDKLVDIIDVVMMRKAIVG